jgi:hypothetical protein
MAEIRPGKHPIDRPCSACSAGDTAMEHHDHEPPFRKGYGPVASEGSAPALRFRAGLCLYTGNPCGTDTRPVDFPCPCGNCRAEKAESALAASQAEAEELARPITEIDFAVWGAPFDADHPQGQYQCRLCEAHWKPNGDGKQFHAPHCLVTRAEAVLKRWEGR